MSIWLFYNAFVLHFILKFDSEVNSNSYKDVINTLPTNLDEMLQQHSKTFHLIILLLAAIEKSYVMCEVSQLQNYHFILKVPLWLKKLCIKKKAEIQYVSKTVHLVFQSFSLLRANRDSCISSSEVWINSSASHAPFDSHNISSHSSGCFLAMQMIPRVKAVSESF